MFENLFWKSVLALLWIQLQGAAFVESDHCGADSEKCNAFETDAIDDDQEASHMKVSLLQGLKRPRRQMHELEATRNGLLEKLAAVHDSISAMTQVRAAGSCRTYGCNGGYAGSHDCQCTANCAHYGNCCSDYKEVCQPESCAVYGCHGGYISSHRCQCTPACVKYKNCCSDFAEVCSEASPPAPAPPRDSCAKFGCDTGYIPAHSCQCSSGCVEHKNCCSDYQSVCLAAPAPAPVHADSCANFGCGVGYVPSHTCQCSSGCAQHNNCCSDYVSVCLSPPAAPPPIESCANYGCYSGYMSTHKCQCTSSCQQYNNCCSDYELVCLHHSQSDDANEPPVDPLNAPPAPGQGNSCATFGCGAYVKEHSCQCSPSCVRFKNCCPDYKAVCESAPAPAPDSCANFGCSGGYVKEHSCQCTLGCIFHGNCCSDFAAVCMAPPKESCKQFGCDHGYNPHHSCQCSPSCVEHNNCCSDYEQVCGLPCENVPCKGDLNATLQPGASCDPLCDAGDTPLGQLVCPPATRGVFKGPGCAKNGTLDGLVPSDVDAVADAEEAADMVFPEFKMVSYKDCLIWPKLSKEVKSFILLQASKYGPSKREISRLTKLGTSQKTEFFVSIEQVSILVAQLLCGATEVATGADLPMGGGDHPQPFAFGRAFEHWFFADDGSKRDELWRRTTLVGYGTFDSDEPVPNSESNVSTGVDLTITSGCGTSKVSDFGLGDSGTMTVVFAGHYVGGFLEGWDHANRYGAQEEKFGTIVPEMMLATEPKRHMGAGLLSHDGDQDPWLPEAGWYIVGAGSYVKGLGYPKWGSEKVHIRDKEDYFPVGNGRRMRRHGLVAILGKPCNDRGSCADNTNDIQYKCYNRQVEDNDVEPLPRGGNLWGIAGGAFNFDRWPETTAALMQAEEVQKNWLLQAGGWGAGAFGCGTLYGGLVQALAAKKGGWKSMRMCWADRTHPYPAIDGKMGYVAASTEELREALVNETAKNESLMTAVDIHSFSKGKLIFSDVQFGAMAGQLGQRIEQVILEPTCKIDTSAPTIQCNKPWNHNGNCISNMEWCCAHTECNWHKNKKQDLRDFVAHACNEKCGAAKGFCAVEDIPAVCRPSTHWSENESAI